MSKDDDFALADPIEKTAKFKMVEKEVTKEVEEILKRQGFYSNQMGYCHAFWPEFKRILKDKFNIDWKSPAEISMEDPLTTTFFD